MVRKKSKNKKKQINLSIFNVILECMDGCHIVRVDTPWLLGFDECVEGHPDICVDLEEGILMFNNTSNKWRTMFCTIPYEASTEKEILRSTKNIDSMGNESSCTTFCSLIPPKTLFEVCFMNINADDPEFELKISSDIQDLPDDYVHGPFVPDLPKYFVHFPYSEPKLCTQGNGGSFTHFFPGTAYAFDFRADTGVPLLAVGDGEVTNIRDSNTASGVHVDNLFGWNSLMIKLNPSILTNFQTCYVEYVHIAANSCKVKVGDYVKAGQEICLSGAVGFCPEPHLHLQMHDEDSDRAPTVPFAFVKEGWEDLKNDVFIPVAGERYGLKGKLS